MSINLQWERSLEKMFKAALKEKFDRWSKEYDRQNVFEVWTEMAGRERFRPHFRKVGWKIDMTIKEAFEALDDYCEEIENEIRKREEKN